MKNSISKLWRSYFSLDQKIVYHAVDLPMEDLELPIPAEMSEQPDIYSRSDFNTTCTANKTPKYIFVDLHVGKLCTNALTKYS